LAAIAALYGDLETLGILNEARLSFFDINNAKKNGETPLESARWRKSCNAHWVRKFLSPRDEDPESWFDAFMNIYDGIKSRQDQDPDSVSNDLETTFDRADERSMSEAESSGQDSDQEKWEKALESPNATLD